MLIDSSLQCPRAFPSWWWPCSPCKPCSGWPRRKGWRELSVSVGIPVVSSLLRPDYEWSKCLVFPFTSFLSFLVIVATIYWVPTTWKAFFRSYLCQSSQQFCKVLFAHFTDEKLRVMEVKRFSQGGDGQWDGEAASRPTWLPSPYPSHCLTPGPFILASFFNWITLFNSDYESLWALSHRLNFGIPL